MRTIREIAALRSALAAPRAAGASIGLVPTMGALHDGHLSLVDAARGDTDVVVVSLFVNPAQFGEASDLAAYPRDEARDADLAAAHGADLLFAPPVEAVYPPGFCTHVEVTGARTSTLEGAARGREHFDGVTTIVAKLFNIVGPDVAYFGQKDAQQAAVIGRMARDLDMPVRIELRPTVREPDGLALSSRNARLDAAERERAVALRRGLDAAQAAVATGEPDAAAVVAAARAAMADHDVEPEYVELLDPETLEPQASVDGRALVAVAARIGATRLIDNQIITANGRGH